MAQPSQPDFQKKSSPSPVAAPSQAMAPRPFSPQADVAAPDVQAPDVAAPKSPTLDSAPAFPKLNFQIRAAGGSPPPLQPKLTIGAPNDKYEQEADRVAAQVVQRIHLPAANLSTENRAYQAQSVQRQAWPEQPVLKMKSMLQRETLPAEEDELQMKPLAQQIQRMELPDDDELQMKPFLQRQGSGAVAASDGLEAAIQKSRGSGQPLADSIREPMEQAFGDVDFRGVKVHTDGRSDQLNRSIQAKAFTTGQDIFFREGTYQPGNRGGQELIAHELTHVAQQQNREISLERDKQSQREQVLTPANGGLRQIQRVSNTGIAGKESEETVGKMATYVWDYQKKQGVDGQDLESYLRDLFVLQMGELKARVPGCPELGFESVTKGNDYGQFDRKTWKVCVRTSLERKGQGRKETITKVGDLTKEELGEFVDTIHHEVRHAEQWYRVAQKHIRDELNTEKNKNWESLKALTEDLSNRVMKPTSLPKFVLEAAVKAVVNAEVNVTAEKVDREGTSVQETEDGWDSSLTDNWNMAEDEDSRKETEAWASILTGAWSTYNAEVKYMQDVVYPKMTSLQAAWPVKTKGKRLVITNVSMENDFTKHIAEMKVPMGELEEEIKLGQKAVDNVSKTDRSRKGQEYTADWNNIVKTYGEMVKAWKAYLPLTTKEKYESEYKTIRGQGEFGQKYRPDVLDKNGGNWADAMEQFRQALYRAYVNAAHEEDAHAVGARVKQTVMEEAAAYDRE